MKFNQINKNKLLTLAEWLKQNLPLSLTVEKIAMGYSYEYYIYQRGLEPKFIERIFSIGDPIARISGSEILLYHTQYFGDIEDAGKKYEIETGKEITLTY